MSHSMAGPSKRYPRHAGYVWYIDKRVKRYGRLCESTGTSNREEAERYLMHRLCELREIRVYGQRPQHTFRDATQKYLAEYAGKKSIDRDAAVLQALETFIGDLPLDRINSDCFARFRKAHHHLSVRTRNQKIVLARRVLRLAATTRTIRERPTDTCRTFSEIAESIAAHKAIPQLAGSHMPCFGLCSWLGFGTAINGRKVATSRTGARATKSRVI